MSWSLAAKSRQQLPSLLAVLVRSGWGDEEGSFSGICRESISLASVTGAPRSRVNLHHLSRERLTCGALQSFPHAHTYNGIFQTSGTTQFVDWDWCRHCHCGYYCHCGAIGSSPASKASWQEGYDSVPPLYLARDRQYVGPAV